MIELIDDWIGGDHLTVFPGTEQQGVGFYALRLEECQEHKVEFCNISAAVGKGSVELVIGKKGEAAIPFDITGNKFIERANLFGWTFQFGDNIGGCSL